MPATPVYALPYPAAADPADVPLDLQELCDAIEAKIAPGTVAGQIPVWDNAAKKWVGTNPGAAPLPGAELGYGQITTQFNVTATSSATATAAITLSPITLDGSTRICLEFGGGACTPGNVQGSTFAGIFYDGSTAMGVIGYLKAPVAIASMEHPFYGRCYVTPGAGSHTFSSRFYVLNGGTGAAIFCGTGVTGNHNPAWMRVTRA